MKCLPPVFPNGNFIGTCTALNALVQQSQAVELYCSGVYNVDQFYNTTSNTQIPTGPCSGSIATVAFLPFSSQQIPGYTQVQPITGGTGAYRGASGIITRTLIIDPIKCPIGGCFQLDFNLN